MTVDQAVAAPTRPRFRASVELAFPAALLVLLVGAVIAFPSFRVVGTYLDILSFSSVLFIIAIGQTLVVIGRGVDLSVGSMAGLAGAVFATLTVSGWSSAAAAGVALLLGLAVGAIAHGLLITKLGISFMIVTLGTYSLLRSQAQVVLEGKSITIDVGWLDALSNGRVLGIPSVVLLAAGLYLVAVLILRCTGFGRALYATGSNPLAARLAGLPIDRVTIIAFAVSGLFAALAGLLTVGQLGSAQPGGGAGLELTAIAAVLLGGTRFSGGFGSVTRTLVGVLFLAVLNNVLYAAGVSSFWQGTASGAVLIAAVAIDRSRKE
ncbi:ABC transporter permease [Nonomuraea sp. NPDC049784]|uniref:ABC transporter permease n=1 Tax=Nonomuraea sp. NPDC049784 TaxID=3154361 RepID=UPI0033F6193D